MNNEQYLGFQTFIELYGCPKELIDDQDYVKDVLLQVAEQLKFTVVDTLIHHFSPIGVSGVVVIQESHIAVHTWPEHNYVALDFFTCNQQYDIAQATQFLQEKFKATKIECNNGKRGDLSKINLHQPKKTTNVR